MKTHMALRIFLFVCALQVCASSDSDEKWFEQYLDHFSVWDNRTFMMRYFENNDFYKPGGPLLLEIGAEVTADPGSLTKSPSYALASKLHGKVVLLEHRYYGKSSPFESDNLTTTEYTYLNVEQALEDLAYFVETFKKTTPGLKKSKVAVFGCSYGGSLATWFRYKFPHLVDAAWASSAPLRVALDFYQFYEVVGEIYSNVSSECIAIIRQGYREAKQMLSTPEGTEEVAAALENWTCGNVTEMSSEEVLASIRVVMADQYTEPNHGKKSCEFLQSKNASTSCFEQLSTFVVDKSPDICTDDDPNDTRAWTYQVCTEFGFSFELSSAHQPFRDNFSAIENDATMCKETFGDQFDIDILRKNIDRMNRVYGSTALKVTRVVTIHGTQDPWHKLGLLRSMNNETPVFVVKGGSHCSDTNRINSFDLPELSDVTSKAINIISGWLQK